jgi:uncharacterized membrane protein
MRVYKVLQSMRTGLWFVPVMCVIGGVALSFGTIAIDRAFDYELIPEEVIGGPDAALAILSTIAISMVSLTTLVLTITMVVVQLAMGQFSPRIVQTILKDKPSQIAIGIFVATFAHAMLVMREVSFEEGSEQVPGLAIVVAFVLVLISIAVLVVYVHHIGQSLRVASLIELVGTDTRGLIDEHYAAVGPRPDPVDPSVILATKSGVVSLIKWDRLVELARAAGGRLVMVPAMGEFVPAGAPLFRIEDADGDLDRAAVSDSVILSLERTLDQDVAYGFRLLVDIAERSLADSALQDPTTAVQAIDRLHDCLRQMALRPFPDGEHHDAEGRVRLVVPAMDWDDFVHLAFDEIRIAGAGSPPVSRRLHAALEDLKTVVPPDRRVVLDDQLDRLRALTEDVLTDRRDVETAGRRDPAGMGVAVGDRP